MRKLLIIAILPLILVWAIFIVIAHILELITGSILICADNIEHFINQTK